MATAALSYVLQLNAGGFLNPLGAARGALSGFLGTASKVGNIATGLGAAGGILRGIVGTLTRPITLAAEMESVNAEFGVLLQSVAKGKQLSADIAKMAAATPFESAGLAQNAKTLLGFGVAQRAILPTLKMLGDVAGTSQDKLNSLTLAFAQVSAGGKLTGGDLLQMINAGFNPLQEMSRTTGKSLGELRKDMEDGAISSEMVARAFQTATEKGGRFFGNMQVQSRGFLGLLSTMQDGMATLWRAFGEPVMMALKPALKDATAQIEAMIPLAKQFGAWLGDAITTAVGLIRSGTLGDALRLGATVAFQEGVNTLAAGVQATMAAAGPLLGQALGIGVQLLGASLGPIMRTLGAGMAILWESMGRGAQVLADALGDPGLWKAAGLGVQALGLQLKAAFLDVLGDLRTGLGEAGMSLVRPLLAGLKAIPGFAGAVQAAEFAASKVVRPDTALADQSREAREAAAALSQQAGDALAGTGIGQIGANIAAAFRPAENAFNLDAAFRQGAEALVQAKDEWARMFAAAKRPFEQGEIDANKAALAGVLGGANALVKNAERPTESYLDLSDPRRVVQRTRFADIPAAGAAADAAMGGAAGGGVGSPLSQMLSLVRRFAQGAVKVEVVNAEPATAGTF